MYVIKEIFYEISYISKAVVITYFYLLNHRLNIQKYALFMRTLLLGLNCLTYYIYRNYG